jgi:hypothetical protein
MSLTDSDKEQLLMLAHAMVQFKGPAGEPYRNLFEHGVWMTKSKSSSPVDGVNKACFDNALKVELPMYCGYAMDETTQLPVAHCWNVDYKGNVVDNTPIFNASNVLYFGMPVDRSVATSVRQAASHGDEFMDCWRSAVANAKEDTVNEWRLKLGWKAC